MLRDVPRLYFMVFGVMVIIAVLLVWYVNMYQRESDMLVLNEAIITAAVSEVDESARLDTGVMLLAPTFESVAWDAIESEYPAGSEVQFDYMFDFSVERFAHMNGSVEFMCAPVSSENCRYSKVYVVGGEDVPTPELGEQMAGLPIKYIRVKVRDASDSIDGVWTYVSTVKVDAISHAD